jgi:hypothetical protein
MSLMVDRLWLRSFSVGSVGVTMLQESGVYRDGVHDLTAAKLHKAICLGAENTGFLSATNLNLKAARRAENRQFVFGINIEASARATACQPLSYPINERQPPPRGCDSSIGRSSGRKRLA